MDERKKIIVFADWYEPGYRAGGPIRSCVNFVRNMRDEYRLYVFTSDRDLGAAAPYPHVMIDEWHLAEGKTWLYYSSPEKLSWRNIREQIKAIDPDLIYLNSMFSGRFTIFPLLICRLNTLKARIVLAPRGMLRESAVRFKPVKKKIFLKSFRWLGFQKNIRFHASDQTEAEDIRRNFGANSEIAMIPNFPGGLAASWEIIDKKAGELSIIFVGRIHPIKNLDYLLEILGTAGAVIRLTIAGSCEDEPFWEKCRQIIAALPATVTVRYAGEIPNNQVAALIAEHHIFMLPTAGENFGHAIFEALALGKPVLISDQTPWKNLEAAGAGWDLPLGKPELFRQAIEKAAALGQEEYADLCRSTRRYVEAFLSGSELKRGYLELFR